MVYGLNIPRTGVPHYSTRLEEPRSVIGEIDTSAAGFIFMRVGREIIGEGGWEQTEHVLLTPEEAKEFVAEIVALLGPAVLA